MTATSWTGTEQVKPRGQIAQKGSDFPGFPAVKINRHYKKKNLSDTVSLSLIINSSLLLPKSFLTPLNPLKSPRFLKWEMVYRDRTFITYLSNKATKRLVFSFNAWGLLPGLFIYLSQGFISIIWEVEDFNTPIRYKRWRQAKNIPIIGMQEFL